LAGPAELDSAHHIGPLIDYEDGAVLIDVSSVLNTNSECCGGESFSLLPSGCARSMGSARSALTRRSS